MSKDVSIKLENIQDFIEDKESEKVDNRYQGEFYIKNEKLYLSYEEEAEGLDGARTIIKIDPERERVLLMRQSPAAMRQDFVIGEKQDGYFKTPYGEIKISIKTQKLKIDVGEDTGIIKIDYQVFLGGSLNAEHRLRLNYKIL